MVSESNKKSVKRLVIGAAAVAAIMGCFAQIPSAKADGWDRHDDRHGDWGRDRDDRRDRWEDWRRREYWEHHRRDGYGYGYGYYAAPRVYYPPVAPYYYGAPSYYPGSFNITIPIN